MVFTGADNALEEQCFAIVFLLPVKFKDNKSYNLPVK